MNREIDRRPVASRPSVLARLPSGRFDVLLAAVLALLATTAHLARGDVWPALLDLLACLAAALTTRWPRVAGIGLGAVLVGLLFTPPNWPSLGEYAALIPILGTGVRGQRRIRSWMTIGYGALLVALTIQDLQGNPLVFFGLAVWVALIAVLWGIGNLFTSYRHALDEIHIAELKQQKLAHSADLQEQRLALARDLHDTVARDLTRASLQAQASLDAAPSPSLEEVVTGIQQASAQLRWMLALLRESHSARPSDALHSTLAETLAQATDSLKQRGFAIATTLDGDLTTIPPALTATLRAVVGEACANIERHADPLQPCVIIVSIGSDVIDVAFLNQTRPLPTKIDGGGVGLAGLRERLALVGGELSTDQEGTQWISRVTIPV